jgi:hypothetical protein
MPLQSRPLMRLPRPRPGFGRRLGYFVGPLAFVALMGVLALWN